MASEGDGGGPAEGTMVLNTQLVLDTVNIETERLKATVAQALTSLQDDAFRRLQAQLAAERTAHGAALAEKNERVHALEIKSRDQRQLLEKSVLKMMRIAGQSGDRFRSLEGLRLCRSVWRQWGRFLLLARRERRFDHLPMGHFSQVLSRKVVCSWRTEARKSRMARSEAYWRAQVEAARRDGADEGAAHTAKLEEQLQQAREQVQMAAQERDALEEELKRAFMRGVCALNMEAVSILRHGGASAPVGGNAAAAGSAPASRPVDVEELRTLQAQTGEAMLELSRVGPNANVRPASFIG